MDSGVDGEIPSLRELCKCTILKNIHEFEKRSLGLPPDVIQEVLTEAGSRVTSGLLDRLYLDQGKSRWIKDVLEPFWERLARARFRKLKDMEAPLNGASSWRKRFHQLEKQQEERLQRSVRLMESKQKKEKANKKKLKTKMVKQMPSAPPRKYTVMFNNNISSSSSKGLSPVPKKTPLLKKLKDMRKREKGRK